MFTLTLNQFNLSCAAVAAFCLAISPASADMTRENDVWITRAAMQTDTGYQIPAGAYGIFVVNRPREVSLLDLRGMAGRGDVILRGDHSGECLVFQARFVAGDFEGDGIGGHLAAPIRIVLQSRRVARALAQGHDVVSDTYRVTGQAHQDADVVLGDGLADSYGFVINPGRNAMDEIFGVAHRRITCTPVS